MPMIDIDKLKPTLAAWQANAADIVRTMQACDEAFLRGDKATSDALHERAQELVRERHDKADNVAKLVEALIWEAERGDQ